MPHSKGPWYKSGLDIRQNDGMASAHRIIAQIQTDVGMDAANANADLIAAAPGMLARLRQALVYVEHPDVQALGFCKPAEQMAEQIRSIIREATEGR